MEFIFLLTGLIVGAIAAWLIVKNRFEGKQGVDQSVFNQLDKEKSLIEQQREQLRNENVLLKSDLKTEQENAKQLSNDLTHWKTNYTNLEEKLVSQKLNLVLSGFGVGLSWGSAYIETENIICSELIEL